MRRAVAGVPIEWSGYQTLAATVRRWRGMSFELGRSLGPEPGRDKRPWLVRASTSEPALDRVREKTLETQKKTFMSSHPQSRMGDFANATRAAVFDLAA